MNAILNLFGELDIRLLAGGLLLALCGYAIIPRKLKFPLSLFLLPLWMTISLCELIPYSILFKYSLPLPMLAVIVSAFLDPKPRRSLPLICQLYHILAFISLFYVFQLDDFKHGLLYRATWVLLGITAHWIVKKIRTPEDLFQVLRALGTGFALSIIILIPSMLLGITDPYAHYKGGRFRPWGTHPNAIGHLFFISLAFFGILHSFSKRTSAKVALLVGGGITIVMGLLTCSRSVIFPLIIFLCIFLGRYMKRPGLLIFIPFLVMIPLHFVLLEVENINWSRLNTLESRRSVIFTEYWEVIKDRPLFGVMKSSGESYYRSSQASSHPHNGFIMLMYLFGSSLSLPFIFLFGLTQWNAFKSWLELRRLNQNIANSLLALSGIMIFHSMVTYNIYSPTNHLAFLYLFLSMLFFTIAYSPNPIIATSPRSEKRKF